MRRFTAVTLAALVLAACGSKGDSTFEKTISEGKAIAKIGDRSINEGYLKVIERAEPRVKGQLDNPAFKKRFVDNLIEQEIFYQEGLKRGLSKKAEVQEKLALIERAVIANQVLEEEADKSASEYYEKNKSEFERVKVAHLFFSNLPKPVAPETGKAPATPSSPEEEKKKAEELASVNAKKAYERLKNGEKWDVVAKEMSDDKSSATRGGEIGYLTLSDPRAERLEYKKMIETAMGLKKEAYSEPILTKDGWHIVKVLEEKSSQKFEDVSMAIKMRQRGKVKEDLMARLRTQNKVEYLDTSLIEGIDSSKPTPQAIPPSITPAKPESKPLAKEVPVTGSKPPVAPVKTPSKPESQKK